MNCTGGVMLGKRRQQFLKSQEEAEYVNGHTGSFYLRLRLASTGLMSCSVSNTALRIGLPAS